MLTISKKYTAFTLAEVLITLGIIGVIATLTIPPLINKSEETKTVTAVKKANATLSGVYQNLIAEYDDMPTAINALAGTSEDLADVFSPKMNVAKICGKVGNTTKDEGCFPDQDYSFLNAEGTFLNLVTNQWYSTLITNDGIAYAFAFYSSNCEYDYCGEAFVDVNGPKGPTKWGKDLFDFVITPKGIYPYGVAIEASDDCSTSEASYGYTCADRIIRQGDMNYEGGNGMGGGGGSSDPSGGGGSSDPSGP
jgi:type II secretory pathway pseudopilin PulG